MAATEHNLAGYLPLMQKWRWPILGVTLAACIISAITALLLPNIYRSTAIFYPTNLPDLETTLNPEFILNGEKLTLSMSSDDADRLISIGQSEPLLRHIIQKFNFAQHYRYPANDTSDKVRQKVLEEFLYNYSIAQNNRSAVEVSFDDADKYFAAQVANTITQQIDVINQQLTLTNQQKMVNSYAQRQQFLQKELLKTQDSLVAARRQYGIFGTTTAEHESRPESRYLAERLVQTETDLQQARATLKSYQAQLSGSHDKIITLKADIKGLEAALNALKSATSGNSINLESYVAGTDEVTRLEAIFDSRREEYVKARQIYEDAKLALQNQTSSLYVVQPATPAIKKVKPIRWLIVMGATFLTFLLSVVVVSILERRRSVRHARFYA
ncbi:GumC domain-containing protein [Adhaeribacter radiodurans]|uniref:Polysaccharide chain length determinant N-terminal domain-containing protein n=1 Tax=Adhaeribacter radiodurans TaxID=2745197 RepID=A0A7L7LEZ2_9BACT|nr:hypothetical protein [Adhaeribacter radiodurans]QMU31353.1 hypothetical protein HUW48_26460 [Adhaeribacter radiodurans]